MSKKRFLEGTASAPSQGLLVKYTLYFCQFQPKETEAVPLTWNLVVVKNAGSSGKIT